MAKKLLGTISGLLIAAVLGISLYTQNPKRPEPHFITWTLIYYTGETVGVF